MKRILSLVLSMIISVGIFCCFGIVSYAAKQTEDIDKTQLGNTNTYYSFNALSKTLTISGTGNTPDFKNDSISQPWYLWRSNGSIEHVIVEEGIISLGNFFFYNVGASDFELPSTLVKIGNSAMGGIKAEKIELPENLTEIGDNAFRYSVSLESINIPAKVTKIGASAFENCISLKSVIFENMYAEMTIGSKAFLHCPELKSVTVPKRAALMSYSFGFETNKVGYVYSDFVLKVYRDSPAYTYAKEKIMNSQNYYILNEFVITQGQSIDCEYFSDSYKDEMIFIFTPKVSDYYKFFSASELKTVDVDCEFNGNTYDDNSSDDLNFTVKNYLQAGKTYSFRVKCVSAVSIGKFTVHLSAEHSYESIVTPPTLTDDGYTTYTCTYCGDSYETDFVKRTGIFVTGRVVLMESPDGLHPHNLPVVNAVVSVGKENLALTDKNGAFAFYIEPTEQKMCISSVFSVDRTFDIAYDENMEMPLGDISLFNFDYYKDGYVNAKDFAVFRSMYGKYLPQDEELYIAIDYNQDGVIDYDDFKFAQSFFTYGKITESIYD